MSDHSEYFKYLKSRSRLGGIYRRFWLYPRIAKNLSRRTLDVGCGIGDFLAFRAGTIGTDINAPCVEYCFANGLDARLMTENVLPFNSGEFDSVLLDNVLEHLTDPAPLLTEIRRVMRTDGRFVVGVPGTKGWSSDDDHKTFYDEAGLCATIERAGFATLFTFATPMWKSDFLSKRIRQYCIYSCFRRTGNSDL